MLDYMLPLLLIAGFTPDLPLLSTSSRRKAVTVHRVLIEPAHRKAGRQFYKAILNGEVIVAQNWSPEFAACRNMQKRGLTR